MIEFRAMFGGDTEAVLRLNQESVSLLSPLDAERLSELVAKAALVRVAEEEGQVVGLLIVFAEGAGYDSLNYRWFEERFRRFLYIDRVVVDASRRGRGIASGLYRLAEEHALASGARWLVCEVNVEPPNPVSLAFHDRRGFVEVARREGAAGKILSLRARSLG